MDFPYLVFGSAVEKWVLMIQVRLFFVSSFYLKQIWWFFKALWQLTIHKRKITSKSRRVTTSKEDVNPLKFHMGGTYWNFELVVVLMSWSSWSTSKHLNSWRFVSGYHYFQIKNDALALQCITDRLFSSFGSLDSSATRNWQI